MWGSGGGGAEAPRNLRKILKLLRKCQFFYKFYASFLICFLPGFRWGNTYLFHTECIIKYLTWKYFDYDRI